MLDSDIKPSLVCAFCSKRSLLLRSDTEFGLMIALCQVHTSSCDVRTKKEGLRRTQLLLRLLRIWQFCIHYTTIVNQNCFQMRWFRQLPRADSGEARADGWDGRDLPVWPVSQSESFALPLLVSTYCTTWRPDILEKRMYQWDTAETFALCQPQKARILWDLSPPICRLAAI